MEKPEVSVVIVSYNTADLLRGSLLSLEAGLAGVTYETWVVDNASSDGSAEMVAKEFPAARLIANRENLGFAKANNQALRLMNGNYALLLNSDAMLEPGTGKALLDFIRTRPLAGMAGPRLLGPGRRVQPSTYPLPGFWNELLRATKLYALLPRGPVSRLLLGSFFDHGSALRVGRLTGACVLVPKTAMDAVGLLCEDFFFYGEVHDWCWTMIERGLEIWFYPGAAAVHLGGQSSKKKWDGGRARLVALDAHDRMLRRHRSGAAVALMHAAALAGDAGALAFRAVFRPARDAAETARLRAEVRWYLAKLFGIHLPAGPGGKDTA